MKPPAHVPSHDEAAAEDLAHVIERVLTEAWTAGTRAWPGVVVEAEPFARYLADRVDPSADVVTELRALHVGDLYLTCACAAGIPNAIGAFERTFFEPADHALARRGFSPATIDEAKQLLRVQFFVAKGGARPRIAAYGGRGDLKRWVFAALVRTAIRLQKTPRPVTDDAVLEAMADARQDFELDFFKRTYQRTFEEALRDAFGMLTPSDRNLLRYYFVKGLSIDQLGVIYHVHRATAARRVRSVNEVLVARTRELLGHRLGIGSTDVSSILRLVKTEYERSLRTVLAAV